LLKVYKFAKNPLQKSKSAGSRHKQYRQAVSGRWANKADVPALTANIFAVVTMRTNKTKQGKALEQSTKIRYLCETATILPTDSGKPPF
jgi:hypothetical protein